MTCGPRRWRGVSAVGRVLVKRRGVSTQLSDHHQRRGRRRLRDGCVIGNSNIRSHDSGGVAEPPFQLKESTPKFRDVLDRDGGEVEIIRGDKGRRGRDAVGGRHSTVNRNSVWGEVTVGEGLR